MGEHGRVEQRSGTDMDGFLFETLPGLDVSGKKVAIFGVGDQSTYSANFCDAAGEIYDLMTAAGATFVGMTSTDGYEHEESKSIRDGKFVGMMCDEDNQYDLSEGRAQAWGSSSRARASRCESRAPRMRWALALHACRCGGTF